MLRRFVFFGVLVGALFGAAPAVAAPTTVEVNSSGETVRVPTRPRNVAAERVSPTKGKFRFDPARSRGSKIRRYRVYCRDTSENSNFWAWASDDDSPLVLRNLQPGLGYECTVRAKSRAGYGTAAHVTLRANPS